MDRPPPDAWLSRFADYSMAMMQSRCKSDTLDDGGGAISLVAEGDIAN
jgi:hypothetical protein